MELKYFEIKICV